MTNEERATEIKQKLANWYPGDHTNEVNQVVSDVAYLLEQNERLQKENDMHLTWIAEIGFPAQKDEERYRKALEILIPFTEEVLSWHGNGYGVANFHMNGDLEPLDNFIDDATPVELEDALQALKGEDSQ